MTLAWLTWYSVSHDSGRIFFWVCINRFMSWLSKTAQPGGIFGVDACCFLLKKALGGLRCLFFACWMFSPMFASDDCILIDPVEKWQINDECLFHRKRVEWQLANERVRIYILSLHVYEWKRLKVNTRKKNVVVDIHIFFIGNSIFHLSLEFLTDFGKMRLKVA